MSYVTQTGDEKYRGGYGSSSSSLNPDELRVATSTFDNYISGTVLLVFLIFFVFLFVSGITVFLMCYARYLNHRRPKGGFYDPPPMISRYGRKSASSRGGGVSSSIYSTLQRPSDYSGSTAVAGGTWSSRQQQHQQQQHEQPPTAPSAMSYNTEASYTATSTML